MSKLYIARVFLLPHIYYGINRESILKVQEFDFQLFVEISVLGYSTNYWIVSAMVLIAFVATKRIQSESRVCEHRVTWSNGK